MATWTPADLSPVAWYDVDKSTSTTAITDSSGNARADLAFGAGSNSPIYVAANTSKLFAAASASNNFLSTANSTAYNTTDHDAWIDVSLPSWAPTNSVQLYRRLQTGQVRAYVLSAGTVQFTWYNSAGTTTTVTTTDTVRTKTGIADGDRLALRYVLDVDTGSGYSMTIYYRVGGYDGTWDTFQTFTGGTATSFRSVTSALELPTMGDVGGAIAIHAFEWRDSIDGTAVAKFDAKDLKSASFTDQAGKSWTLQIGTSGRKWVTLSPAYNAMRAVVLAGTDDWLDGPTAAVPSATSSTSSTVAAVIRPRSTQAAGKVVATTRATTTGAGVSIEMAGTASVRAVVSDGTTTVTTATVSLTLGARALVGVILTNGSPGTARVFVANRAGVTLGATSNRTGNDETGGDLRCFADQSGGNVMDVESEAPWMSWSSALTSAQLSQVFDYYDNAARAEVATTTATANNAATNTSSTSQAATATAAGLNAATRTSSTSQAATATGTAIDAYGLVSAYAECATAVATANGATGNVASTSQVATATATGNAAGASVTAPAEAAAATAEAFDAIGHVATGAEVAAATIEAAGPGTDVATTAEAATATGEAFDGLGQTVTFAYAEVATASATANGAGTNVATAVGVATATATAHAAGSSAAPTAQTATATATAANAATSAEVVVATVAAVVALALAATADSVVTRAIRATFRESTRGTFQESTRGTFRETRQT